MAFSKSFGIFLGLLMGSICVQAQQCNIPGRIVHSYALTAYSNAVDSNDCLSKCKTFINPANPGRGCEWWSIDYDQGNLCLLWNTNEEIDTANHPNAESGENECQILECDKTGLCQGTLLGLDVNVATLNDCVSQCNDDPDIGASCNWVSFDPVGKDCFFFQTCTGFMNNTFTSGFQSVEKACKFS